MKLVFFKPLGTIIAAMLKSAARGKKYNIGFCGSEVLTLIKINNLTLQFRMF